MISIHQLTKLYHSGRGIKNVSLEINQGEIFGYLGPNGAGKTTTIRTLMGFLRPDKGTTFIDKKDCWKNSADIQKNLGYIPGEIAFFNEMTALSFLKLLNDLRNNKNTQRQDYLIDYFQLDCSGKIKKMSKGMKQKLGIVAACMNDPTIMIFDEPSAGLDPLMQDLFVQFVLEEKRRGKTILMSSHSFEEIDRTCDRAAIIRNGEIVAIEDINILKQQQKRSFVLTIPHEEDRKKIKDSDMTVKEISSNRLLVDIQGDVDSFIKKISTLTIENIEPRTISLEEVFMQYYGRESEK